MKDNEEIFYNLTAAVEKVEAYRKNGIEASYVKRGIKDDKVFVVTHKIKINRPKFSFEERLTTLCRREVGKHIEFGKLKTKSVAYGFSQNFSKPKPTLPLWNTVYDCYCQGGEGSCGTIEFRDWLVKHPGNFGVAYKEAIDYLIEDAEERRKAHYEAGCDMENEPDPFKKEAWLTIGVLAVLTWLVLVISMCCVKG